MASVGTERINNTLKYHPNLISGEPFAVRLLYFVERIIRIGEGWITVSKFVDRALISEDVQNEFSLMENTDFVERFVSCDGSYVYSNWKGRDFKVNIDKLEKWVAGIMDDEMKKKGDILLSFNNISIIPQPISTYKMLEHSVINK